jgi:hypothetical protein
LLLTTRAPITFVAWQLGHKDASITLRVYAHWVPDDSRREADRLDALHQDATQAQPAAPVEAGVLARVVKLLKKSGEPPRNRTENPQIKSRIECVFEIPRVA